MRKILKINFHFPVPGPLLRAPARGFGPPFCGFCRNARAPWRFSGPFLSVYHTALWEVDAKEGEKLPPLCLPPALGPPFSRLLLKCRGAPPPRRFQRFFLIVPRVFSTVARQWKNLGFFPSFPDNTGKTLMKKFSHLRASRNSGRGLHLDASIPAPCHSPRDAPRATCQAGAPLQRSVASCHRCGKMWPETERNCRILEFF